MRPYFPIARRADYLADARFYAARIEDLGPGDFVKVDCAACSHTALLAPAFLNRLGLNPRNKVLINRKVSIGAHDPGTLSQRQSMTRVVAFPKAAGSPDKRGTRPLSLESCRPNSPPKRLRNDCP